jgi:hypothetical protein
VADSCKHSDKPSDSMTGEEFLEKLGDHQLPKKDLAPWSNLHFVLAIYRPINRL